MKRQIYGIMMAVLMCGMSACSNEFDPLADGNYRLHKDKEKLMMKTVKLSFGGDFISESEEPLLRAEEQHTYKALNVYWTPDNGGGDEEIYAYGVFVDDNDVNINLFTGYKYRFEATVLMDDRDKIELLNNKYNYPFRKRQVDTTADDDFEKGDGDININKFHYAEEEKASDAKCYYLSTLKSGQAYVDLAGDRLDSSGNPMASRMDYPRVKRYFGETDGFQLTENASTVTIPMAYKSFGLKIIIESLPFGTLKVADVTKDSKLQDKQWQSLLLFPKDLEFEATSVSEGEDDEENAGGDESEGGEPIEGEGQEGETDEGEGQVEEAEEGESAKAATDEENSYQGLFSMHSMTAGSATFKLRFTWNKGEGLSTKTFSRDVEVHPNKNKILKVNVSGTKSDSKAGNIIFDLEEETLAEDPQEITYTENK